MSQHLKVLIQTFFFAISLVTGFAQKPTIDSILPSSGPIGSTVIIKGTNFNNTLPGNIVYFGAVKAIVSVATDTTLTINVPSGATYLPISVTTNGLTSYSKLPFVITFPGGGSTFSSASFMAKLDILTGNYPHWVGLADFDGNGKPDIVVSRGSSSSVSIFANNSVPGAITLGAKQDFTATGSNHEGGGIADFDGDGKLDFVITNSIGSSSVSVFRNTSTGGISMATKKDYPVDSAPYGIAIGDIDGDGKPDLAVPTNGSLKLCIYRNMSTPGNINFAARIDYPTTSYPFEATITDLDNDGKPDIAITIQGSASGLYVMKNNSTAGNIDLVAPVSFASNVPFTVFSGDFNNDGKPDLTGATGPANTALVLTNTSTQGTIDFGSSPSFTVGSYVKCAAITDLDGDGKPEIFTANNSSNNISILRNTTTGSNISFESRIDFTANQNPTYVAAGDLDGDGRPEILCANASSDGISILKNIIGANVVPVITSFTPSTGVTGNVVRIVGSNFSNVTSVSFGGIPATGFTIDSSTSISAVVGEGVSGSVSVSNIYGTGSLGGFNFIGPIINSFTPTVGVNGATITITGTNFTGTTNVSFGGIPAASFIVNSSTSISAILGSGGSGNVTVISQYGSATKPGFSYGVPSITSFSPAKGPVGTTVMITGANFNSVATDNLVLFGGVKALVTSATSTQLTAIVPVGATYKPITVTRMGLTAYSRIPFHVTYPIGGAITDTSFINSYTLATGAYPADLITCDLTEDGKLEVIVVNNQGNSISIFKNNSGVGNLTFSSKLDYATGSGPKRIAIGDLDGDGKQDIVVTNFNAGSASTISVFRNTSSGSGISMADKIEIATGNGSLGIAISDLNLDGKPDIIVSSGNSGYYSIFTNTTQWGGLISFTKQDNTVFDRPDAITLADIDNDGKPDLVTANYSSSSISVLRNISTSNAILFASRINFPAGASPINVSTADFNNDGKLDIIVANYASSNLSLYKNESTSGTITLNAKQDFSVNASNVVIADVNGDGKLDFSSGKFIAGTIAIVENTYTSTGNFTFNTPVSYPNGNYDTYVSICDLDGDGRPEIMGANTIPSNVVIYRNKIGTSPLVGVCNGSNTSFISNITGSNYQWQVNTENGFINLTNDNNYSAVNTAKLQINNTPSSWYDNQYRCLVDATMSNVFSLQFSTTWTGTVNNQWENPANWACGVVPDGNTDVTIYSGTAVLSSNLSCRSLTINNGGSLIINSGYTLLVTH